VSSRSTPPRSAIHLAAIDDEGSRSAAISEAAGVAPLATVKAILKNGLLSALVAGGW
jgi:hypothetical protein